jgi:hypothetical protein
MPALGTHETSAPMSDWLIAQVRDYMTVAILFQIAASVTTLTAWWQMGNKSLSGPIWGIVSQVAWFGMVASNGLWILLPMVSVFMLMHIRNLRKWLREEGGLHARTDAGS